MLLRLWCQFNFYKRVLQIFDGPILSAFSLQINSLLYSQVEYIDHSGQARFASAEAPNEALPYNCRPNFGAAWLTKDKFKVNIWDSAFKQNLKLEMIQNWWISSFETWEFVHFSSWSPRETCIYLIINQKFYFVGMWLHPVIPDFSGEWNIWVLVHTGYF